MLLTELREAMKSCLCAATILLLVLLSVNVTVLTSARHISRPHSRHGHPQPRVASTEEGSNVAKPSFLYWEGRRMTKRKGADTLQVAGSRLPDCSHACGSCSPCRLVMVSFVCASLEEAETCPMAYKCMCHNKSYPVP